MLVWFQVAFNLILKGWKAPLKANANGTKQIFETTAQDASRIAI